MQWEGKNVLVTGAAGLIGSNLACRLAKEGAIVRIVVHEKFPPLGYHPPGVSCFQLDLTRPEDCRKAVHDADAVFHCAAVTSGAAAVRADPLIHVTPNIVMAAYLLEAAYREGVKKFIWLSSSTVYPPSGEPIAEEQGFIGDPGGISFFAGWMKRLIEVLCRMYGEKLERPMPTVVLRPSNVYGAPANFDPETSHVIPALIKKVVERQQPLEIWGTGDEVRDVIHVDDMVAAMVRAAEVEETFAVFNVGSGIGVTIRELAQRIAALDGCEDVEVRCDPQKPTTFSIRILDVSKIERGLGFRPSVSLDDGLARTIEWFRKSNGAVQRCSRGGAAPVSAPAA